MNYLAVEPELRRQGLGRLMMSEVERRLKKLGCPKLNLQVRRANVEAAAFYRKMGYSEDDVLSLGKRLIQDGGNPGIYPIGFGDINKLEVGLDDEYLYVKISVNGTLPKDLAGFPAPGGDQLHGFNYNLGVDTDNDSTTGCTSDGGAEALIGCAVNDQTGAVLAATGYFTDPTGIESPEGARYANKVFRVGEERTIE